MTEFELPESSYTRQLANEYADTWSTKRHLDASVALPVGVLTGLGMVIWLFVKEFHFSTSVLSWVFVACGVPACSLFALAAWNIVRAVNGLTYKQVSAVSRFAAHYRRLNAYAESAVEEISVQAEYLSDRAWRYEEALEVNAENNISKSAFLHQARRFTAWCVVAIAVLSIPATIDVQNHRPKTPATVGASCQHSLEGSVMPEKPRQQPPKPAPEKPSERPTPPPNSDVREGEQPRKKG